MSLPAAPAPSGTVVRDRWAPDGRTALVTTLPGVRLLEALPAGGPVVALPAVRDDGTPVRVLLVTAPLDPATRRRVRAECSALEAALADVDPSVVLPLLDHGVADVPYLLVPGLPLVESLSVDGLGAAALGAAARALAAGLGELAGRGIVGPVPPLYEGPVLGTPLPPVLVELSSVLGSGTGHEPPEVLGGGGWTPAGQAYACASMLWTLLSGRPPYGDGLGRLLGAVPPRMRRADVPEPVVAVLRDALAVDPAARPAATPDALADALASALPTIEVLDTLPPTRPVSPPPTHTGGRPLGSRYLLDTRIGRGATGHVWAGRRREDGSPVAVKLIRGELAEDPDVVARFLRERATLVRLSHPNLVRVHDLVAEGEVLGIVMDLVEGADLRRLAVTGPLSVAEAAGLLAQAASALAAVHAAGVVHRDVKPENVLVTERDGRRTALLTDFGTARAVDGPTLTRSTQLVGTPAYLAPELVAGRSPEPPADVYSLGITAYELFTGRRPYPETSTEALLRAHLDQPVTRPDGLSDDAWALVAACLDKQPERRPSAAEAATRFAALADPSRDLGRLHPPEGVAVSTIGEPVATRVSERPVPARPAEPVPPKKRRWLLVGVAALVAVLGLGVGAYLGRPAPHAQPAARPTPSPSVGSLLYPIPAVLALDKGNVTVSWDSGAATLPGFQAFFVFEVTGSGSRAVSGMLARDVNKFRVSSLRPGRQSCFTVIAYGVTAPRPNPAPPPACVTPPSLAR
ncbi:MAG: hypothetical protein AUI14_15610 [Actinobacteria bacterium 13_2_20CM_2_71_6]|nr:MAG: hypothetical protein AUI14_15610 [Actinobacteria bacterium 13_2_20CM_2_71_6]